jgi:hypothetical protein
MIPLLLAPLLTKLAESGLNLIGNAVLNKGKDFVEEKLGVNLDDALKTEEGQLKLLQLQNDREEDLLSYALENRKVDLEFYKIDAEDRNSARQREVAVAQTDSSWLAKNIVPILALIVTVGGGAGMIYSPQDDVRLGLASIIALVLGYYFGTSKGSDRQATAIQTLAQNQGASK